MIEPNRLFHIPQVKVGQSCFAEVGQSMRHTQHRGKNGCEMKNGVIDYRVT